MNIFLKDINYEQLASQVYEDEQLLLLFQKIIVTEQVQKFPRERLEHKKLIQQTKQLLI
jgi:hypothetical protein